MLSFLPRHPVHQAPPWTRHFVALVFAVLLASALACPHHLTAAGDGHGPGVRPLSAVEASSTDGFESRQALDDSPTCSSDRGGDSSTAPRNTSGPTPRDAPSSTGVTAATTRPASGLTQVRTADATTSRTTLIAVCRWRI